MSMASLSHGAQPLHLTSARARIQACGHLQGWISQCSLPSPSQLYSLSSGKTWGARTRCKYFILHCDQVCLTWMWPPSPRLGLQLNGPPVSQFQVQFTTQSRYWWMDGWMFGWKMVVWMEYGWKADGWMMDREMIDEQMIDGGWMDAGWMCDEWMGRWWIDGWLMDDWMMDG